MDPVSLIGLAGSIVNIVDVAAKSINALRDLQQRYKAADLTVNSLIGQLYTLKTALSRIEAWMCSSLSREPQHGQLVTDLSVSLDCCRTLVTFMHEHLLRLDWTDTNELTLASKVKAVFHDGEVKELASHLDRQTGALTLLLTALNSQSLSQQECILQACESRTIINQIKDDSSSLLALKSRASFRSFRTASTCTESSALFSLVFDFDMDLLESNLYQRHMNSVIRQSSPKGRIPGRSRAQACSTRYYLKDTNTRPEVIVPVFGSLEGGLPTVMDLLRSHPTSRLTHVEPARAKNAIRLNLISSMQHFLRFLGSEGVKNTNPKVRKCATKILSLRLGSPSYVFIWDSDIALWLEYLWLHIRWEYYKPAAASAAAGWDSWSLHSLNRIIHPDYVPTESDIYKVMPKLTEGDEANIVCGDKSVHLVASNGQDPEIASSLLSRIPTRLAVFVVDVTYHDIYLWAPSTLDPSLSKKSGFFEFVQEFERHMLKYRPQHVVILFNTIKLDTRPHKGKPGVLGSNHTLQAYLRRWTNGQQLHIHYSQFVKNGTLYEIDSDSINFIIDSVTEALLPKTQRKPDHRAMDTSPYVVGGVPEGEARAHARPVVSEQGEPGPNKSREYQLTRRWSFPSLGMINIMLDPQTQKCPRPSIQSHIASEDTTSKTI